MHPLRKTARVLVLSIAEPESLRPRGPRDMSYTDTDGSIRRRSGWLIPLGVFAITAILSVLMLVYYLAPAPNSFIEEQVAPTSSTDLIELKVHGIKFWIPANYLQFESTRQGGTHKHLAMFALLPDLTGWSNWDASSFTGNKPDSDVVYLLIRDEPVNLSESDRLSRIYMAYVVDTSGKPGPYGLTQYAFRSDSGYRNEDLFVAQSPSGPTVLRCERLSPTVPSPSCLRDFPIGHRVALSYRFKRAHLAKWQDIGAGVDKLIASFRKPPKDQASADLQPRP